MPRIWITGLSGSEMVHECPFLAGYREWRLKINGYRVPLTIDQTALLDCLLYRLTYWQSRAPGVDNVVVSVRGLYNSRGWPWPAAMMRTLDSRYVFVAPGGDEHLVIPPSPPPSPEPLASGAPSPPPATPG